MEGRHSSPSHAAPSKTRTRQAASDRAGSRRAAARAEDTETKNEYAEERRYEYSEKRRSENSSRRSESSRQREADNIRREPARQSRKSPKRPSAAADALKIIALAGAILLVFAFFHHVKDRMISKAQYSAAQPAATAKVEEQQIQEPVETVAPETSAPSGETEIEENPEEIVEDNR